MAELRTRVHLRSCFLRLSAGGRTLRVDPCTWNVRRGGRDTAGLSRIAHPTRLAVARPSTRRTQLWNPRCRLGRSQFVDVFSYVGWGGVGILAVLWVGTFFGVAVDSRSRMTNRSGICAATTLAALVPFVGAFLWWCVRPARTRVERQELRALLRIAEREEPIPGQSMEAPSEGAQSHESWHIGARERPKALWSVPGSNR